MENNHIVTDYNSIYLFLSRGSPSHACEHPLLPGCEEPCGDVQKTFVCCSAPLAVLVGALFWWIVYSFWPSHLLRPSGWLPADLGFVCSVPESQSCASTSWVCLWREENTCLASLNVCGSPFSGRSETQLLPLHIKSRALGIKWIKLSFMRCWQRCQIRIGQGITMRVMYWYLLLLGWGCLPGRLSPASGRGDTSCLPIRGSLGKVRNYILFSVVSPWESAVCWVWSYSYWMLLSRRRLSGWLHMFSVITEQISCTVIGFVLAP